MNLAKRRRVWMCADARFDGLSVEEVVLAPKDRHARLHGQYAISIPLSGRGVFYSGGVEYQTQPGAGYLFCPDELWIANAISEAWRFKTLYISRENLQLLTKEAGITSAQIPSCGAHLLNARTVEAAHQVLTVFTAKSSLLERVATLIQLAASFACGNWPRLEANDATKISLVSNFLRVHFSEHIRIVRLASLVALTPSHLIRTFHRVVGVPPHSYATLVRIRHAEELLRAGVPPAEVADAVGFCDQSHLSRCFRRILRVTPGQYQQIHFLRKRPVITGERVMAYRLRSGEKLWRHWIKLRAARAARATCARGPKKVGHRQ
jgi:AraC-like DNA-binding protein